MRAPCVQMRLPDGDVAWIAAGGIIGRLSGADIRIADPRVSEAHALVTLRARQLKLMALRGWLDEDGARASELVLRAGQRIGLAEGVHVTVEAVEMPADLPALVGLGAEPEELSASVYSIVTQPRARLVRGYLADAEAHVFTTSDGWNLRVRGAEPEELRPGASWVIGGHTIAVTMLPLGQAGTRTTVEAGRYHPPLRIVTRYETVHLHPKERASIAVAGIPARIVTELVRFGAPVPWEMVANEIWHESDRGILRQNWDRNLRTLRAKLRAGSIRDDLVRPDGRGNIELFLLPGDEVVDES